MTTAQWKTLVAVLALWATQGCGGSNSRPLDPSGANVNPVAPMGHPPSTRAGSDTPINSGAGDAVPEQTH